MDDDCDETLGASWRKVFEDQRQWILGKVINYFNPFSFYPNPNSGQNADRLIRDINKFIIAYSLLIMILYISDKIESYPPIETLDGLQVKIQDNILTFIKDERLPWQSYELALYAGYVVELIKLIKMNTTVEEQKRKHFEAHLKDFSSIVNSIMTKGHEVFDAALKIVKNKKGVAVIGAVFLSNECINPMLGVAFAVMALFSLAKIVYDKVKNDAPIPYVFHSVFYLLMVKYKREKIDEDDFMSHFKNIKELLNRNSKTCNYAPLVPHIIWSVFHALWHHNIKKNPIFSNANTIDDIMLILKKERDLNAIDKNIVILARQFISLIKHHPVLTGEYNKINPIINSFSSAIIDAQLIRPFLLENVF